MAMARLGVAVASILLSLCACAAPWPGFECGMGIGGWLTNYKRFNVLPEEWRLPITEGDLEHFDSYITRNDIANIKSMGFDHVRLGFDQIVGLPRCLYARCRLSLPGARHTLLRMELSFDAERRQPLFARGRRHS